MPSKFKVIIVGGGIGGLSLANMLETFDIDYVLLEARHDIAPKEGAGIGLMPNGSFILEQLGIFEAIKAAAPDAEVCEAHIRDSTGKPIISLKHLMYHQEMRHGYSMLFFDRRVFLDVLYGQLKQKEKVHCDSKVHHIEHLDKGVRVTTRDGQTHMGDIVIGADGIHSTIRKELYKTADFSKHNQEHNVPCYYQCSFGIAQDVEGWPQSQQGFTSGRGKSFLVVSGPRGRLYWFLFVKYPKPKYGRDIPRYSVEDEAEFVNKHRDLIVCEGLKFGQLYGKRVISGLTPLHEIVFREWFADRVLLVGDAVHKPNPIGGMGGNAAIETAAELVNALVDIRSDRQGSLDGLSLDEIRVVFKHVQDSRFQRAKFTVAASHELQYIMAMENPILATFALRVLLPLGGKHNFFRDLSSRIVGGSRLKHLKLPFRPHAIPYDHELPAKPLDGPLSRAVWPLFCVTVLYLTFTDRSSPEVSKIAHGLLASPNTAPSTFINYWVSIISPMIIYTVEGSRIGRHGSILSVPLIFLIVISVRGIGRSINLYALLYMFHSPLITVDRPVPAASAKSLLLATGMSFLLASLQLGLASTNTDPAGWLTSPATIVIAFYIAITAGRTVLKRFARSDSNHNPEKHEEWYSSDDMLSLNAIFGLVFFIQAFVSIAAHVLRSYSHLGILPNPIASRSTAFLFWGDLFRANGGSMIHSLYLVWELRRQGYVSSKDGLMVICAFSFGNLLIGPSACWIGVYWFRENVILGLSGQVSS
ncbi:FAD/NAD(P)-binding domain-containing protein [Xylariaceae sp. FL1272]|nr:FAD/NAD(P)-binding domain-containing protein [Xylariaceae sp. FL1272]